MVRHPSLCHTSNLTNISFVALMGLKWRNAGQACISANRVYVQSGVYEAFAAILKERTSKLVVGHGSDKASTIGPVTTPASLDRLSKQVRDAKSHGARILLGGDRVKDETGFFFQPTIIADATSQMLVTQEESFAPVLAIYRFDSEQEVVELANNTPVSAFNVFLPRT
jgi:succinate-semialdehyde dehydrogenase / glutarate-semialdehyde dehydrogenase